MCKAFEDMKEEGKEEGKAEGIIETALEYDASEERILEKLQISPEKAQEYLDRYAERS